MINHLFARYKFLYFIKGIFIIILYGLLPGKAISADQPPAFLSNQAANNQVFSILEKDWVMVLPPPANSVKVTLPLLTPSPIKWVNFTKTFPIPDSLRERKLYIRFSGIQGFAAIKINNVAIRTHLNFPTAITFPVPANLLNMDGENTIDVEISSTDSPDQGIPQMVRVFRPARMLGLTGAVFLIWESTSTFKDFSYLYKNKILSYSYELIIPDEDIPADWPEKKIRCDEQVIDPEGRVIYERFEYIDQRNIQLRFSRKIEIQAPRLWPEEEKWQYTVRLRASSGTGLLAWHDQKIGLRQIETSQGSLFINSERLKIKGCNYRIEYPVYPASSPASGRTDFYQQMKEDLSDIKRLGFNAVRLPNTIAHPYCFYLADSLGLYLFIENSFWRIPEPYFRDDRLLQAAKTISDEVVTNLAGHPSLTALGIGNEIPIHQPSVEKFILILKGYIEQRSSLPLYLAPLNYRLLKESPVTDLYMLNKYDVSIFTEFTEMIKQSTGLNNFKPIFGNVGFALRLNEGAEAQKIQTARLQTFFEMQAQNPEINGYFIESYRDWESDVSAELAILDDQDLPVYPFGLVGRINEKREIYKYISDFQNQNFPSIKASIRIVKKSNFFSLSVFILSILFLIIFRSDYRFKENLNRALFHPFGFFVDLRDRRIISIIDSTIIGLFTNFLVAVTLSAYLYYMRDNLLMEEYLSSVLVPLGLKQFYLTLIESPYRITLYIWLILYFLQLIVVILLKVLNLLSIEKIRFRQIMAVCNWAGASLLFLLPVSLLSFHLMNYESYHLLAIPIMIFFFLWYNFRLGNGLRVLLIMSAVKIFMIIILIYCGTLFTFYAIFESKYGLISYFHLLADAYPLF